MRKEKLYLFTFFAVTTIVFTISIIAIQFFIKASNDHIFKLELENSKREANEISQLVGIQLSDGISKETVVQNLQKTIQNTNVKTSFISMLDWAGTQIAHPDKTTLGKFLYVDGSSKLAINNTVTAKYLNANLKKYNASAKISNYDFQTENSEIIYLVPVRNSYWIIAAHQNIDKTLEKRNYLKQRFYLIFGIAGLALLLSLFFVARALAHFYDKSVEHNKKKLEEELSRTFIMNRAIPSLQQNQTAKEEKKVAEKSPPTENKKRILTYRRDELFTIPVENIAFIYVELTTTYVVGFDGKKSTSNSSLDELHSSLDNITFYRANRQVIINIKTIQKIVKYGNNQLKIVVQPTFATAIIISKNKASEFKQWLNY
jgi:DNA-binding LytR/AlgR family response regulator